MDVLSATNHLEIQAFILHFAIFRDEVNIHPHLQPDKNLGVELRSRTAIPPYRHTARGIR